MTKVVQYMNNQNKFTICKIKVDKNINPGPAL